MATVPLPANIGSYAGRQLGGGDWNTLQQYGFKPGQFGQTIGGYQVYGAGQGDVRLRQVTPTAPAPIPAKPGTPAAAVPGGTTPAYNTPATSGLGQTYSTGAPSGLTGPTGAPVAPGSTVQTQFRDALLKQLSADPNAVSLTDPDLAPQARAFQNAQQRALEQQRRDAAEQAFAGGALGTGAYRSELAGAQQQAGEQQAQYEAGLLGSAREQRMANLMNALQLGQGQITSDEDLRLRMNALNAQTGLGAQDLALRSTLGRGQLGLGLLQAMLGDRQAANRLGFDVGAFNANLNQSAMQQLLAGLR